MKEKDKSAFLCEKCGNVYLSNKKNAPCPKCHTKNRAYQVKPIYCPYCGGTAYLKHKSEFLPQEKLDNPPKRAPKSEYLYVCKNYPECDSFVWTHPNTKIPYGNLANAELRRKRIFAHDCISSIVKLRMMSRNTVYRWLSSCLGYRRKYTHISQMNDVMCEKVIDITLNAVKNNDINEYHRLLSRKEKLFASNKENT